MTQQEAQNKLNEAPKAKEDKPALEPGLVISHNALVVDKNGVAWWVMPDAHVLKRAV